MVRLIAITKSPQHFNGFLHVWFFDEDRRKPALQGSIFFNMLVILVKRGRAHTLQFPSSQGWFEHIRRIHRALCSACPDNRVKLIDEQDNFALSALNLFKGSFQSFFKLPPEARAGNHRPQIKRQHPLSRQYFRDIIGGNFLRQTFNNGSFSNACFPDQYRVIFCPS